MRLPPMTSLRLFEAAGRHLSFRRAAEELNLTPSAVSHGIAALEDWLGLPLFHRRPGGLALTDDGRDYHLGISAALETVLRAGRDLPGRRSGTLRLSVAPTLAQRWLLPRLGDFRLKHPGITIDMDTSQRQLDLMRDQVDLAIRRGRGDWSRLESVPIFSSRIVPVAAPAVAADIRSVADLARHTRLVSGLTSDDWESWFRLAGHAPVEGAGSLRLDTLALSWEMAARGQGVAIGHLPLIESDLADGRLVPVLGPPVASPTTYWAVWPDGPRHAAAHAFLDWLVSDQRPSQAG